MIRNKELLALIEEKKNKSSCENCKHCNKGAYHSGKWYCKNPKVSVMKSPVNIEKCFER
jgi:hypothetical protein